MKAHHLTMIRSGGRLTPKCSCGWQGGSFESHTQATTQWATHVRYENTKERLALAHGEHDATDS